MSAKDDQLLIRQYRMETGKQAWDMREVAEWGLDKGLLRKPDPVDPVDRIARRLAKSARQEVRYDEKTGRPYRANHAMVVQAGGSQMSLWIDIDDAPRPHVQKSLIQRREQMVHDGVQLTLDADHWNGMHPEEEPIQIPLDFTEDVEERKAAMEIEDDGPEPDQPSLH